jgi:hypothetical protein
MPCPLLVNIAALTQICRNLLHNAAHLNEITQAFTPYTENVKNVNPGLSVYVHGAILSRFACIRQLPGDLILLLSTPEKENPSAGIGRGWRRWRHE